MKLILRTELENCISDVETAVTRLCESLRRMGATDEVLRKPLKEKLECAREIVTLLKAAERLEEPS